MIREVKIQNYKSIERLDLELGRINVLIGENGCGKTNILEAIALASGAHGRPVPELSRFATGGTPGETEAEPCNRFDA